MNTREAAEANEEIARSNTRLSQMRSELKEVQEVRHKLEGSLFEATCNDEDQALTRPDSQPTLVL